MPAPVTPFRIEPFRVCARCEALIESDDRTTYGVDGRLEHETYRACLAALRTVVDDLRAELRRYYAAEDPHP